MARKLDPSEIIDYDEKYATVTLGTSSSRTEIVALQVKPGKRAYLVFVGNAVQAGGATSVTFHLEVNRADWYPFHSTQDQWADPSSNIDLPIYIELPISSSVRITADNSDAANTYTATAKFRIVYADFPQNPFYTPF